MADAPPSPPLLLASTSPQRKAILEQLHIPFDVVAPKYEETNPELADAVEVVRAHAREKARSVADIAEDRPVLGVDTAVVLDGRIFGKPASATEAGRMLEELGGKTHLVVSGLCLITPGWEDVEHESTRVGFRELAPRELGALRSSVASRVTTSTSWACLPRCSYGCSRSASPASTASAERPSLCPSQQYMSASGPR